MILKDGDKNFISSEICRIARLAGYDIEMKNKTTEAQKIIQENLIFLSDFILKNYGHWESKELQRAFEMALNKRIEVETKSYGSFNSVFFTNIFASYAEWRNKNHQSLALPEHEGKKCSPSDAYTPLQAFTELHKLIKEGKSCKIFIQSICEPLYRHLEAIGEIKLSVEEKKVLKNKIWNGIKAREKEDRKSVV